MMKHLKLIGDAARAIYWIVRTAFMIFRETE